MAARPDIVVPVLRAGILARQFCERVAVANVEAVFDRCLYLRSGDDFVCIGEPDIGNGPLALIADLAALPTPRSVAGQVALICGEQITIGNSVRLTLDQSEGWCPLAWPRPPSPERLADVGAVLASRAEIAAPREGLLRCVIDRDETSRCSSPLERIARQRIILFERWLSRMLGARHASTVPSGGAVQGLIGLGPGLTPSGDDFLAGALAVLDALGERGARTAMAHAIVDALPGLTTPLSARFLRATAAGHIGENLHRIASFAMTGDGDAAITVARKIGHSSGWDMIAGILTTLWIVATRRTGSSATHAVASS
jgi:hypothetical protein